MPNTDATAAGTESGSPTEASSTIHTPSGNSPSNSDPGFERQPGLADPADAAQRDQPVRPHELGDLFDHRVAADERAELLREVAAEARRRCGASGSPPEARRQRPGTPTSVRADRGAGARPVAADARGCAATPRSRPRRAPGLRAPTTSTGRRGSPRCRSSSGRVRSRRRCGAPCEPRSSRRCRRAAAPGPRSPRPPRRRPSRTRRRSCRHRSRTRSRRDRSIVPRTIASCTRRASAMSRGASSHRRVESVDVGEQKRHRPHREPARHPATVTQHPRNDPWSFRAVRAARVGIEVQPRSASELDQRLPLFDLP